MWRKRTTVRAQAAATTHKSIATRHRSRPIATLTVALANQHSCLGSPTTTRKPRRIRSRPGLRTRRRNGCRDRQLGSHRFRRCHCSLGPKDYDFNIQQFSITSDRAEVVDFSDGYYQVEQAIIGAADSAAASATSISDPQGTEAWRRYCDHQPGLSRRGRAAFDRRRCLR